MKTFKILAFLISYSACFNLMAQPSCGTEDFPVINSELEDDMYQNYTGFKAARTDGTSDEIINIPVVIHVVLDDYPNTDISDEEIYEQIAQLNRDFQLENADINDVPAEFNSAIGNVTLKFRLACVDPNGNETPGVIRKSTPHNAFESSETKIYYDAQGGSNAWPTDKYLNIWIAESLTHNGSLAAGWAYRPSALPSTDYDGIVIGRKYFTGTTNYNKGRTLVHEIGHYLNLKHIWGDKTVCTYNGQPIDDGIDDTPQQASSYSFCQNYPVSSCESNDMFMNYMDYTPDDCAIMFTNDQVTMMRSLFEPEGYRYSMIQDKTPNYCLENEGEIYEYPNFIKKDESLTLKGAFYDNEEITGSPLEWDWKVYLKYYNSSNNVEKYLLTEGKTNTTTTYGDVYYSEFTTTLSSTPPSEYNWVKNGDGSIASSFDLKVTDGVNIEEDSKSFGYILPLSASISGPKYGDNSGTYTWSAEVNGGLKPYSYYWEQSTDNGNTYSYRSSSSSITQQMPIDKDLYLRLTVTDDYGTEDVAFHITYNNDGDGCIKCTSSLSIYPNPSNGAVNLEYTAEEKGIQSTIKIYDLAGFNVYTEDVESKEKGVNKITLDLFELQEDNYIIKFISNGETASRLLKIEHR